MKIDACSQPIAPPPTITTLAGRGPYLEHPLAVEDIRIVERDPGRVERPGTGRDQHGFAAQHSPEAAGRLDDHVAVWPQRGDSSDELDLVAGDVLPDRLAHGPR